MGEGGSLARAARKKKSLIFCFSFAWWAGNGYFGRGVGGTQSEGNPIGQLGLCLVK